MMPHEFPVILGRDFAGAVESVGRAWTSLQVGDRVAGVITAMSLGPGALAEKVLMTADSLVRVPDGVSAAQAAGAGLAAVAAHDLVAALDLSPDDVVLVSGATGGVGAFAVQLAARTRRHRAGAPHVRARPPTSSGAWARPPPSTTPATSRRPLPLPPRTGSPPWSTPPATRPR